MQRMRQPVIRNSKGQPVLLNEQERFACEQMQPLVNKAQRIFNKMSNSALGYEIPITTLTTIMKVISEQKFFEIFPADFVPMKAGEGAWSSFLTTYRSFDIAGDFETGIVDTGSGNTRIANADAGVDALNIAVINWVKAIGWTIMDLEMAAKSGNWDLIAAKEEARKKNWDLGLQRIAFLGARGQNGVGGNCLGLLNQGTSVTVNTSVITKPISSMTPTELKTFTQTVYEAYRLNCNRTAVPTNLSIPESDYNGLASQSSPDFPIKSTLQLLEESFKTITNKPNFKIQSLAYADAAYHSDVASIAGKQVYTLMNYDEKSVRMDVPVPYTNTLANSLNNFSFENAAYGQFTGVLAYRPLEMLYFQYAA